MNAKYFDAAKYNSKSFKVFQEAVTHCSINTIVAHRVYYGRLEQLSRSIQFLCCSKDVIILSLTIESLRTYRFDRQRRLRDVTMIPVSVLPAVVRKYLHWR